LFWESLLLRWLLSSVVDRKFPAEFQVSGCKTMDSDAYEAEVVQLRRCLFFGRMKDLMDETIRGFREPILELGVLLYLRG